MNDVTHSNHLEVGNTQANLPACERRRNGNGEVLVRRLGRVRVVVLGVEGTAVEEVAEDTAHVRRSTGLVAARPKADRDAHFRGARERILLRGGSKGGVGRREL